MGKIKRLVEENPHGICESMVDSLQATIKTLQERTNTNSYTVRVYCDRQGVEVEEVVNLPDHIATSLSIIGVVSRVMIIAEQQHSGQCGTKHDPCISEANAFFGLDPKVITPLIGKLQETINTLTDQIEFAGRIVGQVLDAPAPGHADIELLNKAYHALGSTYFKVTRRPLEWWRDSEETNG